MLHLLLAFIAFGVVCCQDCPIFSTVENDPSLLRHLNGTFYKVLATGTSVIADCQKQTFAIGPHNVLSGYFESPDWCLQLNNCDTSSPSNPDYYQCDLTPLTSGVGNLPSTQRNRIKLAGKIGSGKNLCIIYSYCRIGEEGLYVLCRKPLQLIPKLFVQFIDRLQTTFNCTTMTTSAWKVVKQKNCNFVKNCPP